MSRKTALPLSLVVTALLLGSTVVRADDFDDFKNHAGAWLLQAQEVYRFDEQALTRIWEAYCGELDSEEHETAQKEAAARVGLELQQQQAKNLDPVWQELEHLTDWADDLKDDPARAKDVDELLALMQPEEKKLLALKNGAVLQGSNHPFVQFATLYGIDRHKSLCGNYKGVVSVCDQPFSSNGERPDLVTVNGGGLWVYEFKPKGDVAEKAGRAQLEKYVPMVLEYYQKFFPKGQHGGFDGAPDSSLGGQAMLDALDAEDDAWESGGTKLKVQRELVTYDRCERKF